jgi:hypothetical protein
VDQGNARAHLGGWRPGSVPEQLGLAGLGAAGAAAAYQAAMGGTGLWLPCPLRTLTGIPCPLCGMTTAATGLAAGDLGAAMAANPFVVLVAGFTLLMAVVMAARALGWLGPPGPMAGLPAPTRLLGGRDAGRRELGGPAPPVRVGIDRPARPGEPSQTTGG